jgi:uncharacterized membrane protein YedE/YeeE
MSYLQALGGGVLIGGASALLMLTHGRVAGISGIATGALTGAGADRAWRLAFLVGLVIAGIGSAVIAPSAIGASPRSVVVVALAGLLVGFGTRMGSGCTSGHGICGLSRGSPRSVLAVGTFMFTAVLTASLVGRLS